MQPVEQDSFSKLIRITRIVIINRYGINGFARNSITNFSLNQDPPETGVKLDQCEK
ncbi:hypothetical protein LSTR_LSTR006113 [Laodelphax striatellus]|uniref:Uncharacterized protein n=1 Tax=Laodelphax striatellus TaxID=195883 RepID=A0A482WYD0_LAOST|nr:hypothetical protein LSTR_LSTR006113 [Laodelphax striatellus]